MRWSVGLEAEGDRVLTREEIVELADAVAAHNGIATGIGTTHYGAQLVVEADTRDEAIEKATRGLRRRRGDGRPAAVPDLAGRGDLRRRRRRGLGAVIRLGSLAGYPFEGPRVLAGWTRAGRRRPSTRSSTSPSRRPSSTRSSTSTTPRTCRPSDSRSRTRARPAG